MRVTENLKRLGGFITDLVFPISCLVCGTDGIYLCSACQAKLPKLANQQCLVCQKSAPFGKTHPACITRNSVDGAIAALSHKSPQVREIIRIFKYNFVSSLSQPLASLIVDTIREQGLGDYFRNFLIIPVPLHTRRFNWRGFNQASLLSQSLSEKLGIPMDENIIERTKFTEPQVKLTADQRKRNMENAFSVINNADALVGAKKILLVDDVVTSGSTANELAKLLKSHKAEEVWIVTAAHG